MKVKRSKRLALIVFILLGVSSAAGLALYALNRNINLYYTPSQVIQTQLLSNQTVRIGGLVEKGSVHFAPKGLGVRFVLTDGKKNIVVIYNDLLPTLFREGQGVVVQGKLNNQGVFLADQVLAKHDENYRPPGIRK
ncbi:MAG: cytochrome c maturation protein CcmE [Gammaproteobacteria bacterium]